ncbi:MAG: polysaccharide pyruvyl transferase family protein [Cyclobacteriaceae bacterium]|nr:polysaccharide pyruvyl transferase family protein [Cyclobacteriaceae bacterium]
MKILLKGYYGFGNLGDDILLVTIHHLIKKKFPEATVSVFSNYNPNLKGFDRQRDYNTYINTLVREKLELIDWTDIKEFDLVVDGGGGVYFDYTQGSVVRQIFNNVCKVMGASTVHTVDMLIRKLLRKPKRLNFVKRAAYGVGIGPYNSSSTNFYHHLVEIGSTDVLYVRDQTSINYLSAFKFSGHKGLCADLAFLCPLWSERNKHTDNKTDFAGRIGIILLDWYNGLDGHFTEFKGFADLQRKNGNRVTFFSFDENFDKRYIQLFKDDQSLVVWRPNDMAIDDFLSLLASQDILISARAHGVIIGSILGVPTVTLGTSDKLVEVSRMFPRCTTLLNEPINLDTLTQCVDDIKQHYKQRKQSVRHDVSQNTLLAQSSWNNFSGYL